MKPTIGRIVHYTLTEQDAASINVRRADFRAFEAGHKHPHEPGQPCATGHVAHVGNHAEVGQVYPATVVRCFDPSVNLQVMLDGNDTFWTTSRTEGDGPGYWAWPSREGDEMTEPESAEVEAEQAEAVEDAPETDAAAEASFE
mgnify:FL=1